MQRFRGGLVFKAQRLCVSLNSRLESIKEHEEAPAPAGLSLRSERGLSHCQGALIVCEIVPLYYHACMGACAAGGVRVRTGRYYLVRDFVTYYLVRDVIIIIFITRTASVLLVCKTIPQRALVGKVLPQDAPACKKEQHNLLLGAPDSKYEWFTPPESATATGESMVCKQGSARGGRSPAQATPLSYERGTPVLHPAAHAPMHACRGPSPCA